VTLNNRYEFQMQYGSIGWSVGATLGYAQAAKDKRVIACIGDGSFQVRIHRNCPRCSASFFRHGVPVCSRSAWHWQVTAQDVSTMLRCGQRSVIFLINNGGYTIEVEIHDGPYNVIKNWDYTGLVDAIHNSDGSCWTKKVRTEGELKEAIARMTRARSSSSVSAANSRPANPQ